MTDVDVLGDHAPVAAAAVERVSDLDVEVGGGGDGGVHSRIIAKFCTPCKQHIARRFAHYCAVEKSDINQVVAQSLAYWMQARGMNAKQLGRAAGVSTMNTGQQEAERRDALKTPQQRAAEAERERAQALRYAAATEAAKALRKTAREPDSVKFDSIRVSDDAALVCVEMRGRNGFGGMALERVTIVAGLADRSPKTWNARCLIELNDLSHLGR